MFFLLIMIELEVLYLLISQCSSLPVGKLKIKAQNLTPLHHI